uniref:Family S53 protease-like protein n=1 Tax=Mycena chlorophos TaxID=658473 RepID=A0ABQ0MD69_MYCCL|nr:family S53 protease-like protein [Mycena chlorophos]
MARQARRATDTTVPSSCATDVTPSCLQAMYGIPTAKATNSSTGKNRIGVAGYIEQYANEDDQQLFLEQFNPALAGTRFDVQSVDNGTNSQLLFDAGIEADLDIEYTTGIAGGVPVTFVTVGDSNTDDVDGFIDIVTAIMNTTASIRPTVLTTSYGFNENDVGPILNMLMCNAYTQLGLLGISVLFASGDGGVSGVQSNNCTTFDPTAPGGCPFITSVGGSTGLPPQTAASLSGGGFSQHFTAPDYQMGAVAGYLEYLGNTTYAGLYNRSGRGMPDIAAQAENVEITWIGLDWLVAGTSCASPIFASIIALLNDHLIAAGRPVLGFLNPWLYSPAGSAAFDDVTSGNNPGCNTTGFNATVGWDPVTGLGTPNFTRMLRALGLNN